MKGIMLEIFFYWCKVEFRVISNLFLVLGVSNKERQLIDEKGINDGDIVIHFRSHEQPQVDWL